jgi:hypothetical protein
MEVSIVLMLSLNQMRQFENQWEYRKDSEQKKIRFFMMK